MSAEMQSLERMEVIKCIIVSVMCLVNAGILVVLIKIKGKMERWGA